MSGLTGAERAARGRRARALVPALREQGVDGIVLSFVDTAGINRIKAVPVDRLERSAAWGTGMSPVFDTFLSNDVPVRTDDLGSPDGDVRLVPDLDGLVVLSAQPGWAWAPVDRYTQEGEPYVACQRRFAAAMVERARAAGVTLRAAFEIEWAVGRGDGDEFVPACLGPAYGMTRLVELSDYSRDVLGALQEEGLDVEQLHPEYSDGQYEVSVAAADPVTAADRSVLVRQTIRAVSAQHGLRASFAPSVIAGHVGNGGHLHLSPWRDGRNLLAGGDLRYAMTRDGESFVGGVLAHLPALMAIGAPTPASYLRLQPSHWAGVYACWGRETRETAVRLVTGSTGERADAANVEVKCIDLAANPYLLVGCVLAAGLAGLADTAPLPEETVDDPALLDDAERDARGIERLPTSLGDAVDAFAADDALREALGRPLADAVVAVRRGEIDRFADASPEDVVAALRWTY
ncbi:MAG: glutamine synthetase [Streptosporangiales bacterium]|nr:glutamine synthetase [Streptosporangiales bacterium]MBO0889542.1 glutamine synthetase [Acidothermales bacterium]